MTLFALSNLWMARRARCWRGRPPHAQVRSGWLNLDQAWHLRGWTRSENRIRGSPAGHATRTMADRRMRTIPAAVLPLMSSGTESGLRVSSLVEVSLS
jgi:hypothetical protein